MPLGGTFMITLTSYGAAGEVTGSRHLIKTPTGQILLDCGMFQGPKDEVGNRNAELGFEASEVDAVILSHGHLDHCGSLPTLIKQGFVGKIYASAATRDVAELIMLDAAHIQEEAARRANHDNYQPETPVVTLYTADDVKHTVTRFESVSINETVEILPNIKLQLFEAGHILGSTTIRLEITVGNKTVSLAYTGDLGQQNMPILQPPQSLPETDILITETTYGNRKHETVDERDEKLVQCVKRAVATNGKIIVPAFALGRLQTLIYTLHKLTDAKRIPRIPIYVDSPLGMRITEVFTNYTDLYDAETQKLFTNRHDDPFGFKNLTYLESVTESKSLNSLSGPMIIISSSGMAEAGRVIFHLQHCLADANNTVLIVGYMAKHTLGRRLLEKEHKVKIFEEWIPVRAQIEHINAFSAHADKDELGAFVQAVPNLQQLILVHGDEEVRTDFETAMSQQLPQLKIIKPINGQTYNLA